MSVENPLVEPSDGNPPEPVKSVNGDGEAPKVEPEQRFNGISNGHSEAAAAVVSSSSTGNGGEKKHKSSSSSHHHKSSSKDKHRDKERSEHRSSSKSSHRDKEKTSSSSSSNHHHRDKEKSSSRSSHHKSSRDKDRHHHKSSRDDKERPKEDKERSSKDEKSSSSKDKDRERDKDKEKHRDKEKSSSSSGDKHRDKDKDRHHKSSSSSHHSSSSSKDKDRHSSSSKHRDKDREHKHKDQHRDKDRDKGRDREKEEERRRRKEKERREKEEKQRALEEKLKQDQIKQEMEEEESSNSLQNDSQLAWKDDSKMKMDAIVKIEPLNVSQASSCDYSLSQFNPNEPSFQLKNEHEYYDEESQQLTIKEEQEDQEDEDSEEDIPLHKRKVARVSDDDEDDAPLTVRKKVKSEKKKKKRSYDSDEYDDDGEEEEDIKPKKKKVKKEKEKVKTKAQVKTEQISPTKGGRKKKEEEEQEVWKWWEEDKREDGVKWNFLEHKGPVFAPPYEPLPEHVIFEYDGKRMKLTPETEEIATFYARMLEHDYTQKKVFNDNFFKDWRKVMTSKEKEKITDLTKCNFRHMHEYFQKQSEANKNRSKEEKQKIKEENERLIKEYGFCTIDGHKEKIGNFKIEPPGLFRGRGEHPKMGKVKRRVVANDITINCSKNSEIPKAPPGYKWKEVRHDNTVTWLASWIENVQGQVKYIMLNPSSKLKGEKDWQKYETARRLHKHIDKIRETYRNEWKSKEMRVRQRAVALYFIDILALRAGNEKDEDQADTVGCCSLRVEHIQLHKELNGKEHVVVFDFLGKDSIRYYNEVEVEKRVFKNLELFCENKKEGDDLFDRLNTSVLNEHLRELMEGLTAKVFRTYNASITLQNQLDLLTDPDASVPEKLLQYNRANRAVAILCNHQRAVPKSHSKSMENLKEKIRAKREQIEDCEQEVKDLQKAAKRGSVKEKMACDKKKKQLERLREQLQKLELQETDRDENKTIALGTSKLNYLDPRITVAWCKKYNVPIEKIFNKTHRDKFRWAIDMATEEYRF